MNYFWQKDISFSLHLIALLIMQVVAEINLVWSEIDRIYCGGFFFRKI